MKVAATQTASPPMGLPALSLECSLAGRSCFLITFCPSSLGDSPPSIMSSEPPKRALVNGHLSSLEMLLNWGSSL